jgi:hypothetical protein
MFITQTVSMLRNNEVYRMGFLRNSVHMKEPKLEPKLDSTLSETKRLVWLFHEIAKQLVSEFQFNQLTALDEKQL